MTSQPPPPGERVRAAPATIWAWGALALLTVPFFGLVLNARAPTELRAWSGLGFALLITAGLLLRWRFAWPVAFLVDAYLLVAGAWAAATGQVAAGLTLSARSVLAWLLLLAASTRLHFFVSVAWRDDLGSLSEEP
jgi:hypothetical protein